MVSPSQVSAVLVTRGDVDMTPILDSIASAGIEDVVVWDNSERHEMQVYGRYAAIEHAAHGVIYTQDDDAICPISEILDAYDGDRLLVNVPAGEKPWLAWGALFPRVTALVALGRYGGSVYRTRFPDEIGLYRWPDVIFASLTDWRSVDLGHEDLPHAFAENRMYRMPDHYSSQEAVEQRCVQLGGTVRRA